MDYIGWCFDMKSGPKRIPMKLITVHFPISVLDTIDELKANNVITGRSSSIREAVGMWLKTKIDVYDKMHTHIEPIDYMNKNVNLSLILSDYDRARIEFLIKMKVILNRSEFIRHLVSAELDKLFKNIDSIKLMNGVIL